MGMAVVSPWAGCWSQARSGELGTHAPDALSSSTCVSSGVVFSWAPCVMILISSAAAIGVIYGVKTDSVVGDNSASVDPTFIILDSANAGSDVVDVRWVLGNSAPSSMADVSPSVVLGASRECLLLSIFFLLWHCSLVSTIICGAGRGVAGRWVRRPCCCAGCAVDAGIVLSGSSVGVGVSLALWRGCSC